MNRVDLIGRLTKDPDVRYSQGENPMAIARFTLAVNRRTKKDAEQQADFISCVAFGKTAEIIEKYVKQGTKIAIEGRIQTGSYTNKDNQKVYTTDVFVENIEFAESKSSGNSGNAAASPAETQNSSAQTSAEAYGFANITDADDPGLPFNLD